MNTVPTVPNPAYVTEKKARARVEEIDRLVEDLHGGMRRANASRVNQGSPANQDARWRRYCAAVDALRAERAVLAATLPYEDEDWL